MQTTPKLLTSNICKHCRDHIKLENICETLHIEYIIFNLQGTKEV